MCCSVLHCVAVSDFMVRLAVCCSEMHCVAVCCTVLQCLTLWCVLLCVCRAFVECLYFVAVFGSAPALWCVSQCVVVSCSVLQSVAARRRYGVSCSVLQYVAVCCSMMQYGGCATTFWSVSLSGNHMRAVSIRRDIVR